MTIGKMTIDQIHHFISVTPALETYCECCGEGITEIKGPFSVSEPTSSNKNLSY